MYHLLNWLVIKRIRITESFTEATNSVYNYICSSVGMTLSFVFFRCVDVHTKPCLLLIFIFFRCVDVHTKPCLLLIFIFFRCVDVHTKPCLLLIFCF